MTEKCLVVSLFFLFALSAAYLFSVNERGLDPDQDKDWWSLAFAVPETPDDLSFIITNHTAAERFQYTVSAEDRTLVEGEVSVTPSASLTLVPSIDALPQSGRITITVSHDGKAESIYRAL
ncbi:MAG: hypothetical protein WAT84_01215 [Candidatus Moraniibacteriota bacterium]